MRPSPLPRSPPTPSPATGSAPAPSPGLALYSYSSSWSESSSAVPFILVEHTANLLDLVARGPVSGKGVHHELTRRALEYALQHIPRELPLGLLGGQACFIDVRPLHFVSPHGTFCRHDLE